MTSTKTEAHPAGDGPALQRGVRARISELARWSLDETGRALFPKRTGRYVRFTDVEKAFADLPDERLPPALLTAFRKAWEGDKKMAEAYALLAASNLEERGETSYARYLRAAIDGMTGRAKELVVRPMSEADVVRNNCPRTYNRCGFDAAAGECVADGCPRPNA